MQDPRGEETRHKIRSFLGIPVESVRTCEVYRIDAELRDEEPARVLREFADPVSQVGALDRLESEPFDVVVLDPPRVGAPGVVERLLHNRPRRIIYVACHPPAAARDLRAARDAGYGLTRAVALDLFPETHHVETVVVMDRGTGTARRAGGAKGQRRGRGGRRR